MFPSWLILTLGAPVKVLHMAEAAAIISVSFCLFSTLFCPALAVPVRTNKLIETNASTDNAIDLFILYPTLFLEF